MKCVCCCHGDSTTRLPTGLPSRRRATERIEARTSIVESKGRERVRLVDVPSMPWACASRPPAVLLPAWTVLLSFWCDMLISTGNVGACVA